MFARFSKFIPKPSVFKQKRSKVLKLGLAAFSTGLLSFYIKSDTTLTLNPFAKKPLLANSTKKTLTVCVVGAAGSVSYSLLPLLLSGQCFGPDVKIDLRLLDVKEKENVLRGVSMEIMDSTFSNLAGSVKVGSDPIELLKDIDVGIFLAGTPRKLGMERSDLLHINGKIYKDYGEALNKVAKSDAKVLVVANPANTNCWILKTMSPNLNSKNFTALARLNQNRATSFLTTIRKDITHVTDIKNVFVWGNNSGTVYPDVNEGKIFGREVRDAFPINTYFDTDFVTEIQNRGNEVLAQRKNPVAMSCAIAIKDHFYNWYNGTEKDQIVSMAVESDGSYGVPPGLIFSFPVVCKDFHWKIHQHDKINKFGKLHMKITTDELVKEKKEAFKVINPNII